MRVHVGGGFVCVCVGVCVRERERGGGVGGDQLHRKARTTRPAFPSSFRLSCLPHLSSLPPFLPPS